MKKRKKLKLLWIPLHNGDWRIGLSLYFDGKVCLGLNNRSWNNREFINRHYLSLDEAKLLAEKLTFLVKIYEERYGESYAKNR